MILLVLVAAAAGYLLAVRRGRRPWPGRRTAAWLAGLGCAAAGTALADHGDLRRHMAAHLLVGMVAPLLLVLAAPGTLALRTLRPPAARRLARVLRSAPARVLTDPFVAVAVDTAGLVLLYRSPVLMAAMHSTVLGALVWAHVLLTGWLATAAVLALDPTPHRRGVAARAVALALAMAAHDVLATSLTAWPPAGWTHADAGAQLMVQGGTLVELAVAALLWQRWYASRDAVRAAERAAAPA